MNDQLSVDLPGWTPEADTALSQLIEQRAASRMYAKDATLWGPDAEQEAGSRLGWTECHTVSRPLLAEIDALHADLAGEGVDHVVLCGMGGSSLAPEVITTSAGVDLTVLDSTDPGMVGRALTDRLDRTVVVVSSKSGSTVETDSQRRAFLGAFERAGIDGKRRIVVVTDPGSPMSDLATEAGYRRMFHADPNVGGRYSALTAFGLVPSGLAGADIATLLDDAEAVVADLARDDEANPALRLAALLTTAHDAGREKLVLGEGNIDDVAGLPAWAEQLVAESTGKLGRGILPVDVEEAVSSSVGWQDPADTITRAAIGTDPSGDAHVVTDGSLGGLFQFWESAIALTGIGLGINPFDQPNVEEAKNAARALLDAPQGSGDETAPSFTDGSVQVFADPAFLGDATDLAGVLAAAREAVPPGGYLAVMAYLDRTGADAEAAGLRSALGGDQPFQVTFGWGPRFLHSTGQYHKGGHPNGAFLQVTGAIAEDLEVPDRPYTFGSLITAQAAGDLAVLADKGFPTVRLHLTDRAAGLRQLLAAASAPSLSRR